jgi:DNA polymerase sigma
LSSIHSLAQVLETPLTSPNESAARAIWGSIQEARKVIEACAQEYEKTSSKLSLLEEKVEELKHQVEHEDEKSMSASTDEAADVDKVVSETVLDLRENTRVLMSGRASCERKWRDSQLAFASILKAVVSNPAMNMLLRRDMITKMRIEYELWCPLSEEFAIPSENATLWFDPLRDLTHTITSEDFQLYTQARVKMQLRDLGFEPNTVALDDILFPRNRQSPNQRAMNSDAVSCFNNMSAAMGKYYQELYADEEDVVRLREYVHNRTVKCVEECGAFPRGTRVVIFGSSANGFGSPKSDIDMCLQLPQGVSLSEDDRTGSVAMSKLADYFEESGMNDVDASRLTARIPIVRFFCPNPMSKGSEDEQLIECDLSMHNPLAVLNTSLLRSYAEITPVTRVLASVVKRWAKARDINNPAKHTLSSYGYIIMLLHFLTYHKRSGNGLLTPVAPATGNSQYRKDPAQQAPPVLPNLLWVDPMWPNFPRGTPYRELPSLPRAIKPHPLEEGKSVNSYFYKPVTPNDKAVLQMLFAGQDLSLAILLASFFRYYAYEFDYKRYVVSLHSNATRGIVEREVKAELDGWRNYSAALTIEDPFETSYDIAHVLRGGYYHRIRREFAVAYAKIADAASGRAGSWNKSDMEVMSGQDLIDWICEPVENDRPDT